MSAEKIHVIVTGGSIDGLDYAKEDRAPGSPRTHIPEMLVRAHSMVPAVLDVVLMKDSRFFPTPTATRWCASAAKARKRESSSPTAR